MMMPRTSQSSVVVLLLAALAFTACSATTTSTSHSSSTTTTQGEDVSVVAFQCPESCTCSPVQIGQRELTHAHCESADGLHDKNLPIHSLDLSGLGYSKVPAAVEKLRNLTRLNLSNNHITEVSRLSPRILDLNLGHNRIGSGKLAKLPLFLRKLNLTNNAITVVPSELKKLEHLRELELSGNPINCSCETIQVRNWLQSRRVWTENVIKCALPLEYKGRPWLQVKQSEVCRMTPAEIEEEKNIWEDSNDLMMGDQPAAGSGEGHEHDHHDAIEDDYIPADDDPRAMAYGDEDVEDLDEGSGGHGIPPVIHRDDDHKSLQMEVEGSGFHPLSRSAGHDHPEASTPAVGSDDEDEGSGVLIGPIGRSGLEILKPHADSDLLPGNDHPLHEHPEEDEPLGQPEEEATREPVTGLGIFGKDVPAEVTESPIVKEEKAILKVNPVLPTGQVVGGTSLEDVEKAEKADSKKLYILLAIIVIVMVSLIIFVIIKQRNTRRQNNRRGQRDVENAKEQELQDMNNRMVGKPLGKNGNPESVPLMPGKEKWELAPSKGGSDNEKIGFNPYQKPDSPTNERQVPLRGSQPVDEQVAKKDAPELSSFRPEQRTDSQDSINENNNNNNNNEDFNNNNNHGDNEFHPIQNGYPQENGVSPVSPIESPPSVHKAKRDEDWEKYTPKSPNLKRYSPVYSPETGRVKIKLSETPKPKTPLLVTRSRSNAGQMITTPNWNQRPPRTEVVNGTIEA